MFVNPVNKLCAGIRKVFDDGINSKLQETFESENMNPDESVE